MYEIKIKVNGNGTQNEVNRVKLKFEVYGTIEGSYHYVKFL